MSEEVSLSFRPRHFCSLEGRVILTSKKICFCFRLDSDLSIYIKMSPNLCVCVRAHAPFERGSRTVGAKNMKKYPKNAPP